MKGLALETVVKVIILMVVALVVINLILYFSDTIRDLLTGYKQKPIKTQTIKAPAFTASQIATYIKSCWEKTGRNYEKEVICYILEGKPLAEASEIKKYLSGIRVNLFKYDPNKNVTLIKFSPTFDDIEVESLG